MSEKLNPTGPNAASVAYFLPMGSATKEGSKIRCAAEGNKMVPVHVADARNRHDVMTEWLSMGDLGGVYVNFALMFIFAFASLAALIWVHWTIAAVFAYAAGYKFSEYCIIHVWNVDWYKGKSMLSTE